MASALSINVAATTLNRGVSQEDKNKARDAQFEVQQTYLKNRQQGRAMPDAMEKRRRRQANQVKEQREKQELLKSDAKQNDLDQLLKEQFKRLEARKRVWKMTNPTGPKGLKALFRREGDV